jgi:hypothetical protein
MQGMSERPAPSVRVSVDGDGAVFLDLASGRLFSSNRVGAHIWQGLVRQLSAAAIAADISREYGIDVDTAERDTRHFLAELSRQHLLNRAMS